MNKKSDFETIGLRLNPFGIKPEMGSENLTWAGLKVVKERFDFLIGNCLKSTETKVVLHMSRWGGGKTHTSFYYSNPKNLPSINIDYPIPLNLFVVTPQEGEKAPDEFYKKIIEGIRITYISESIKTMRSNYGNDQHSLEEIQNYCKSEDIGRIIWLLGDPNPEMAYDASELIFSPKPTASLKKKLKIRRGIESTSDRFVVISTLFKILSAYDCQRKLDTKRRIFLWLDEIESLIYYSTRYYKPFTQALRELIDMTPKQLTFFLNFSFAERDTINTLEFIIGKALSDRINEKIISEELDISEAIEYVGDLLKFFRTSGFKETNEFYPFKKEALKIMFDNLENKLKEPLMPRIINKWCDKMLTRAFEKNYFSKEKEIDENFMNQVSFRDEAMEDI